MKDTSGNVPGPQQHAEGQQGDKTRARFQEQLHEKISRDAQADDGAATGTRDDDDAQRTGGTRDERR
jgi:hypothetical protein